MIQTKLSVISNFSGLSTLEPKHEYIQNYMFLGANGIINTISNVPLGIFVIGKPFQLPKKTVLSTSFLTRFQLYLYKPVFRTRCWSSSAYPRWLLPIKLSAKLRRLMRRRTKKPWTLPKRTCYVINVSGITDLLLSTRVQNILENYKPTWTVSIRYISTTKHRLEIKPGSITECQIPYRKGLSIGMLLPITCNNSYNSNLSHHPRYLSTAPCGLIYTHLGWWKCLYDTRYQLWVF